MREPGRVRAAVVRTVEPLGSPPAFCPKVRAYCQKTSQAPLVWREPSRAFLSRIGASGTHPNKGLGRWGE